MTCCKSASCENRSLDSRCIADEYQYSQYNRVTYHHGVYICENLFQGGGWHMNSLQIFFWFITNLIIVFRLKFDSEPIFCKFVAWKPKKIVWKLFKVVSEKSTTFSIAYIRSIYWFLGINYTFSGYKTYTYHHPICSAYLAVCWFQKK